MVSETVVISSENTNLKIVDSVPDCNCMKKNPVLLFGNDISHLPNPYIFFIGSTGIFVLYLIYGAIQEYLFKTPNLQDHFVALTAYQFALYSLFAVLESRLVGVVYHENFPAWLYLSIGLTTTGTILLSNASVVYLNYPTQVIFKCCKLIPVMACSILIHGKRYKCTDYVAVAFMIIGLIFFTLTDVEVQPSFQSTGLVTISLALCADGYIGNLQELAMKSFHIPSLQILAYSYGTGFVLIMFILVCSGSFVESFVYIVSHPMEIFGWGSLFSLSGYFGLHFVLLLVHHFGALPSVTVTTLRKALTIIISFLLFSKPFAFGYVWSGCLVVIGIYLSAYSKMTSKETTKVEVHGCEQNMQIV